MECPCPVPPEQRPLREYEQLADSWFFRRAQTRTSLVTSLLICWLGVVPLALVVAGGSVVLRHHPTQLLLSGGAAAMVLPVLLLLRQWLGWSYVHRRLVSERVEYEESGWYDGQVWEKPLSWRQQDLLVARHQVSPVLVRLQRSIAITTALLLMGIGLCQAL